MPKHWCCTNGHQWEAPAGQLSAACCPVCGSRTATAVLAPLDAASPDAATVSPAAGSGASADSATPDETLFPPQPSRSPRPRPAQRPPEPPPETGKVIDATVERPAPPPAESPDGTLAPPSRLPYQFLPPASLGKRAAPTPMPDHLGGGVGETLDRPGTSPGTPSSNQAPVANGAGTASASAVTSPDLGREKYEVLGLLGRGGMGVVYKARHKELNRLVALKMISAGGHASANDLARFHTEAEAVAGLQHPNIVQIYETGERDGRPYLALEYIDGGALDKKLDSTPLAFRSAAELAEALARAMHYAHQRHIVHRDLKPANVLLTRDGTPKVTDFGLAKRLHDDSANTGTGTILGTPSYMAPEQAAGKVKDIGPPADIYALGAILYDCLTGRPPFRGETVAETLDQVRSQEPVPPRRLQPKVPRDLETVCLKCLQKEPPKRYASAGELADDLRRFLDGQPIKARPVSPWERAVKWARRRPAVAGLLAVLAAVIAGSLIGLFTLWQHAEAEGVEADRQRNDAIGARKVAVAARDEAVVRRKEAVTAQREAQANLERSQRILYATHMGLAMTAVKDGHRDRARALLKGLDEGLHGFEWGYLWRQVNDERLALKGHTSMVNLAVFSPDGKRVATASLDRTVKVWDVKAGRQLNSFEKYQRPVRGMAFTRDGGRLATASADGLVRVWEVGSGAEVLCVKAHDYGATAVAFSPDGKLLASAGEDRRVNIWDVEHGRRRAQLKGHSYAVTAVAFSPDGKTLASGSEDRTVKLWEVATGGEAFSLPGHLHWVGCVAFSPDGKQLATGGWDQTVKVWDLEGRKIVHTLAPHSQAVNSVAFDPAGRFVASACTDGTVSVWDLSRGDAPQTFKGPDGVLRTVAFSEDGQRVASVNFRRKAIDTSFTFDHHRGVVHAAVFSPDGTHVVSGGGAMGEQGTAVGGEVLLWNPDEAEVGPPLEGHRGMVYAVACSPDGKLLATAGEDATVRLWNAATRKELRVLEGHGQRVTDVKFGPRGAWLVSSGADGRIIVWDAATGAKLRTLSGHSGPVHGVAVAAAGDRLASAGADATVRLWDARTGKDLQVLKGHEYAVTAVAFSPDGKTLASASEDQTVRLWDVETGAALLKPLQGHNDGVTCVAFSPSGRRLATGSEDRTVKLWDVVTGEETLTLKGHTHRVNSVAFDRDGTRLVSASNDQTVRIWDATPLGKSHGE